MDRVDVDRGIMYSVHILGHMYNLFCSRTEITNKLCCYFDGGVIYIAVMWCACRYTFE